MKLTALLCLETFHTVCSALEKHWMIDWTIHVRTNCSHLLNCETLKQSFFFVFFKKKGSPVATTVGGAHWVDHFACRSSWPLSACSYDHKWCLPVFQMKVQALMFSLGHRRCASVWEKKAFNLCKLPKSLRLLSFSLRDLDINLLNLSSTTRASFVVKRCMLRKCPKSLWNVKLLITVAKMCKPPLAISNSDNL